MANTGRVIYNTLIKVSNDGNNTPLDENNIPINISGKPQAKKPNLPSDPDYVAPVYNVGLCPLPIQQDTYEFGAIPSQLDIPCVGGTKTVQVTSKKNNNGIDFQIISKPEWVNIDKNNNILTLTISKNE